MSDPYAQYKWTTEDCPDCGTPIRLVESDIDQQVKCEYCGGVWDVEYDGADDAKRRYILRDVNRQRNR